MNANDSFLGSFFMFFSGAARAHDSALSRLGLLPIRLLPPRRAADKHKGLVRATNRPPWRALAGFGNCLIRARPWLGCLDGASTRRPLAFQRGNLPGALDWPAYKSNNRRASANRSNGKPGAAGGFAVA